MIRRALWMGGVAAFASLAVYGISRVGAPEAAVHILQRVVPAILLWCLFRPYLEGGVWSRLVCLVVLFHFQPIIVYLFFQVPPVIRQMEARFFIPLAESASLLFMAFTIPIALGTPSIFRSGVRVAFCACIGAIVHSPFFDLTAVIAKAGSPRLYQFWMGFGMLRHILLFAALAPDHIAMQRAALARRWPLSCEKCAYDLTGNVSGVCPECGTALSDSVRQRLHAPALQT
jgi:hypothetical protein